MHEAFPRSDYYGPSAPPRGHRLTTSQPEHRHPWKGWPCGSLAVVPTFTAYRSTGEAPSYAPATSPRLRRRHSPWPPRPATLTNRGVPNTAVLVRIADQPRSTGFELAGDLRSVKALVPLVRLPVLLAGPGPSGSPDPSRRCRGCLPPSPSSPGSGCPQLRHAAATARRWRSLTSTRYCSASWRTRSPSLRCWCCRIAWIWRFGGPRAAGMAELSPCRMDGSLGMAARCPLMTRPLIESCDCDRWVRTRRRGHR